MAGGASNTSKAYCGKIDLMFLQEKLLNNINDYLAANFSTVKIKISKENLVEDLERIKAVRELIGPDVTLLLDAIYSVSLEEAI